MEVAAKTPDEINNIVGDEMAELIAERNKIVSSVPSGISTELERLRARRAANNVIRDRVLLEKEIDSATFTIDAK